jgi:hypothetical protein
MNFIRFLGLLLTVFCSLSYTQAPDTSWTKCYGGTGDDVAYSVQQTSDGGYIIVGSTESYGAGAADVWLLKTDENGDILWTKTYGGSNTDIANEVLQTADGGFILVGTTSSFSNGTQVYVIKTNENGDSTWTKTYGDMYDDEGWSILQTSDLGYIICGQNSAQYYKYVYLIKTEADGNALWYHTYGSIPESGGYSVKEILGGGFIIAGYIADPCGDYFNIYLIQAGVNGDTMWTKEIGTPVIDQKGFSVQQTIDRGFIIAGYTETQSSGNDMYVVRTNPVGDSLWSRMYGGSYADEGYSIQQTPDSTHIISGMTYTSSSTAEDVYVLEIDDMGNVLWEKTYGGSNNDRGYAVHCTQDGGYIVAGTTASLGAGNSDVWLLKLQYDVGMQENNSPHKHYYPLRTVYSDKILLPAGSIYSLYDITGRQIQTLNPAPGIYFIEIDNRIVQKVVKIK